MARNTLILGSLVALASARAVPHRNIKRQVVELRDSYDFIIAGAGTAGLTVADRLSEAFPDLTVLVIEPGEMEASTGVNEPPGSPRGASLQMLQGQPMTALNNRTNTLMLGHTVGGSSAVNGQFFDRGCRYDFDDWKTLGGAEFEESEEVWDWDGVIPWYRKSVTFTEPTEADVESIGYTWDLEAYGGSTPVHSSYPPFQWPIQNVIWKAWEEAGVAARQECANGDKDGICWVPTSQNPWDGSRATSRTGHYDTVIEDRGNYDLLVGHKALRVIYDEEGASPSVELISILPDILTPPSDPVDEDEPVEGEEEPETPPARPAKFTIPSTREIILSAGAIHTPQILQRSGIGPAHVLAAAGIDLVHDLPGVGYNFHDHGGGGPSFRVDTSSVSGPSQGSMSDPDFAAEAIALYEERPAQGPYTTAMGNSAIYISLPNITETASALADAVRAQVRDGNSAAFLPAGTPKTVIKGYEAQLLVLADAFENHRYPILETPFSAGFSSIGFLLKPLSRGTIMLDPEDVDGEPVLDWRTCTNPIDLDVIATFIPFFRRFFEGETVAGMGVTEVRPGKDVTGREEILEFLRGSVTSSFMHPCCTAAMMPLEKGGVVGPDLRVHGLGGLRVVDASVFPTIPGTHTSATVYAVGEKAADIIIRQNSKEMAEPEKKC